MATVDKGVLGGFSGKVGSVVGFQWRGITVMRSLPQKNNRPPSEAQLLLRQRFRLVMGFLTPLKPIVTRFYEEAQGSSSPFNLATSYHLKQAVQLVDGAYVVDYPKVLISKGYLAWMEATGLSAEPGGNLSLSWEDNSGQAFASEDDKLLVSVYAPALNKFELFIPAALRADQAVTLSLPPSFSGQQIQCWATFVTHTEKAAATSTYLGSVTLT